MRNEGQLCIGELYRQNMETHHPFHDISVDGQDQSQKPGQSELKQRTTYRYSVKRRGTPEDKLQVQWEVMGERKDNENV